MIMKKGGLLIILLGLLMIGQAQESQEKRCLTIKEAENPRLFKAMLTSRGAIDESYATYEKWRTACFRYLIDGQAVDIVIHRPMRSGDDPVPNEGWATVKSWATKKDSTGTSQVRCPPPSIARLEKLFLTPPRL